MISVFVTTRTPWRMNGIMAVANAEKKAAASTDELGSKVAQERAEIEAKAHNESVQSRERLIRAKRDI